MEITKENVKKNIRFCWPVLVLLLYIGVNTVLILNHENWRDEAQAWQIAKQLNPAEIFAQLKYEGHPFLWYAVLVPFAKLGLPFAGMGFVSLACMSAAAWLILKKSPFPVPVRVLIVFSSFFVYYYPVVSRSYCLIPPILAWLAVLYPTRREKPVLYGTALALLTQVHVFVVPLSLLLSAFWLAEAFLAWKKEGVEGKQVFQRNLAGLGISLASGLFLAWELFGSEEANVQVHVHLASSLNSNLHRINVGTQWGMNEMLGFSISDGDWRIFRVLILAGLFAFLFYAWKEALIYTGFVATQFLMFTYVYLASPQKAMILGHGLIFILWIIREQREKRGWKDGCCLLVLLALLFVSTVHHRTKMEQDMTQAYSSSKSMAAYIEKHVPGDVPVAAAGDLFAEGTAAYLEREVWYPVTEEPVTFLVWDDRRRAGIRYEEMLERVRQKYPEAKEMYLICGDKEPGVYDWQDYIPQMEEKFCVNECITDETASLYRVGL